MITKSTSFKFKFLGTEMNSIGTLHNHQQTESLTCSHLILLLGVALPNTGKYQRRM